MGEFTSCHSSYLTAWDRHAFNVLLDLNGNEWTIRAFTQLPDGVEPQITPEELNQADAAVRRDANVIKFAAEVGVDASQIRADGWSIGYDNRFGRRRLQQCLVFARFGDHENLYAHPLDFFPVLDSNTFEGMRRRGEPLRALTCLQWFTSTLPHIARKRMERYLLPLCLLRSRKMLSRNLAVSESDHPDVNSNTCPKPLISNFGTILNPFTSYNRMDQASGSMDTSWNGRSGRCTWLSVVERVSRSPLSPITTMGTSGPSSIACL